MKINIDRCLKAMKHIEVSGHSGTKERQELIELCISQIGENPDTVLKSEYMGIKNYAHFGDQGSNHPYGMGPRHGSIVFSIQRVRTHLNSVLSDDEIYLLECCRDFPAYEKNYSDGQKRKVGLCEVLRELGKAQSEVDKLESVIDSADVESQLLSQS